jgi:RHS repeat-associated protein
MNQPTGVTFSHDSKGNLCTNGGSSYTYDAQNRLTHVVVAGKSGNTTVDFYYDAKNRQIARSSSINGVTFSVWDDWELVEEYAPGNVVTAKYLQGAHGPIKSLINNVYYYQDSLGSTSHIASSAGALLEYYKYDLNGKPTYFAANGTPLPNGTAQGVVDLFAGERWIPDLGLYDDRNRFYDPGMGRFLQPDPIGFKGDASNLYRYCGNDWANRVDPLGLEDIAISREMDLAIWRACQNSLKAGPPPGANGKPSGEGRMQGIEGTKQKNGAITNMSEQKDSAGRPKFAESLAPKTESRRESGDRRFSGNLSPTGAHLRTVAEEKAQASSGKVIPAAGHAHFDVTGNQSPDFSQRDWASARKGQIIGKVNESNPGKVTRLTPQTDGSEPKEKTIEPPKVDPRQGNNGDVSHSAPDGMPDVQGASTLLSSAGQ